MRDSSSKQSQVSRISAFFCMITNIKDDLIIVGLNWLRSPLILPNLKDFEDMCLCWTFHTTPKTPYSDRKLFTGFAKAALIA